jgi:UDP-3-O-[3-hydroxymyristoyl] glucosamine N-acyltransferase
VLLPVYIGLIFGIPFLCVRALLDLAERHGASWLGALLVPPVFVLTYVVVAACLARPTVRAIVPGKMIRDLGHFVYGPRRLYGVCWTSLYYFPVLYHAILAIPVLRRMVWRLFGYRGSLDFTIYPDTWVRDLPLLDIGAGAYIANRATLGSNICLKSGDIVINHIRVGARAVIGHLAVLGLGDHIGDDAEIGVGTTLGVNVRVGDRTTIGAIVGINHGAQIGNDCEVESMAYVGKKAVIHDGLRIRYASVVPDRAVITNQEMADQCVVSGGVLAAARIREQMQPAAMLNN